MKVKSEISLLQLGITPLQLFKSSSHPNSNIKKLSSIGENISLSKRKQSSQIKSLTNFINDYYSEKTIIIYDKINTSKLILITKNEENINEVNQYI